MIQLIREHGHDIEQQGQGTPLLISASKHQQHILTKPPQEEPQPEPDKKEDVESFQEEIIPLDVGGFEKPKQKKQHRKPPNFHIGLSKQLGGKTVSVLLEQYIPLYSSNLPKHVSKQIERIRGVVEERVYSSETASPAEYLRFVYNNEVDVPAIDRTNLQQILAARLAGIEKSIEFGNMEIQSKRKEPQDISQLVRLKEGQIKSKLDDLKNSMSNSMLVESVLMSKTEELDPNYFNRDSERTKQAEQFVRRMNEKQERIRRKFEQLKEKEKIDKEQQRQEEEFKRQQQRSMKHITVKERHERRRELKRRQEQLKKQQHLEFHEFVKEYKLRVPLYKRKEQAFCQNFLLPEYEKYRMRLDQIKQQHQPITAEQLQEHERKYLDIKSEHESRRQQEFRLRMSHDKKKRNSEYYRGKFHDIVMRNILAEKTIEDPKDEQRMKRFKQETYAKQIKTKFVPKVDLKKRKQMEELIQSSQPKRKFRLARKERLVEGEAGEGDGQELQQPDPKVDGKRNMQAVKRMIESYKREGKIKKNSQEKRAVSVSLQPRTDYLKEMRHKRPLISSSRHETNAELESIQIMDPESFQRVRMRAALIDEHAQRRERYMRYNRNQPVSALEESSKLQDEYLASIRAKLSILQSHDGRKSP